MLDLVLHIVVVFIDPVTDRSRSTSSEHATRGVVSSSDVHFSFPRKSSLTPIEGTYAPTLRVFDLFTLYLI